MAAANGNAAPANNIQARRAAVEIDFSNVNQVFERIQRDKRCFMETSYIKSMIEDINTELNENTKRVLGRWLSLLEDGLYLGEGGLVGALGGGIEYRREFNAIDADERLTDAQKQTIKNDYLLILPFLRNPPGQNELAQPANNNNNNNNRTVNNGNNFNLVFELNEQPGSPVSILSQGGHRKRKTRRHSKKSRKLLRKH